MARNSYRRNIHRSFNDKHLVNKVRRYRDSFTRRRIMDRAARHLKYNDGIKDIVDKIKSKISETVSAFKALPTGKKVAYLLSKALQVVMVIFAAKNVAKVGQNLKTLKSLKSQLQVAGDDPDFAKEKALASAGGAVVAYNSLKVVISLLGVFIATVTAKLAIAQKQIQEGEDEERIVIETMTR